MMDVTRAAKLYAAVEDVRKEATTESQREHPYSIVDGMEEIADSLAHMTQGKRRRDPAIREYAIRLAVAAVRYAAECTDYSPPIGKGDEVGR